MQYTWTSLGLCALAILAGSCGSSAGTRATEPTSLEADLRAAADTWMGAPYAPGGTDMSGVDPVAFVRRLYDDLYGINLARTPSGIASAGEAVEPDNLAAGDLLIFRLPSGLMHVGIYLGSREFSHVSVENGVTVAQIDDAAWHDTLVATRRLSLPGVSAQESRNEQPRRRNRTGW